MGYVDKNLLPGETVEYRGRLHPVIYLQSALLALAGLGLIVVGLFNPALALLWVPGAALLASAAGVGVARAVRAASSEFAVTNKRVLIKVGVVHRHTLEMLLSKVETVRVDQGIVGRLLGYGTIVVTGTGGTNEPFPSIAEPLEFRRQVQARAAG